MPNLKIYSWTQYATRTAISNTVLRNDMRSNRLRSEVYKTSSQNFIGETFTFKGGAPAQAFINDDDTEFKDAYVETGTRRILKRNILIDGNNYPSESILENEFSLVDESGNEVLVIRINGQAVGFSYPVGQYPMQGDIFSGVKGKSCSAADSSGGKSECDKTKAGVVYFAEGVLIRTPLGACKVEELEIGDRVNTLDHGPQAVRWVHSGFQSSETSHAKDANPVLIKAGALGRELPEQDLIVSPQHRILVGGHGQLQDQFKSIGFAPAKSLTSLRRVRQMRGTKKFKWVHFAFDRQEIVYANGCLSELPPLKSCLTSGPVGQT